MGICNTDVMLNDLCMYKIGKEYSLGQNCILSTIYFVSLLSLQTKILTYLL